MTYIYENRSVRHDAGPDMRFQLAGNPRGGV